MKNIIRPLFFSTLFYLTACQSTEKNNGPGQPTLRKASIAEIEVGIKDYIARKTQQSNGYFIVNDRGREFKMRLVRVHTEYLSSLGPGKQFACVDLVDTTGDVYDVDFFMDGGPEKMEVTETSVHKLNGKPYYAWKQKADKTWFRLPMKEATNGLLGVVEGVDHFEFYYHVNLKDLKSKAKIWVPLASSDAYQSVEVRSVYFPDRYDTLKEDEFGNTILFAELSPKHSSDSIHISYRVTRKERGPVAEKLTDASRHLVSNATMPIGGRFEEIARTAIKGKNSSDLMKARALYDYVIDNMRYMKYGNFGGGDSNYACDVKTGNCSEFHSLFISLARSIGIPSRFAIGASIPSDRNDGGIDGYHCWAEFYADGKWWPVDISEANKYTALATYYFGHHPANRIELTRGRDLKIKPGPKSGPVNFLAYPYLEIDGKEVRAKATFTFRRVTPA
ncbi:MAG: transglutaminase domain-containing protein [Bacteroidetes bacterium]|nr:transglutaminase domain-containing protein [Bacteroidota bacterium]